MPTIPCAIHGELCSDFPISNYSSESPDVDTFYRRYYRPGWKFPPMHNIYWNIGCIGICFSFTSQAEADACAQAQWYLCNNDEDGDGDGGEDLFWNVEACCTVVCPDGTEFTYCVGAGTVLGNTPQEAQTNATNMACHLAQEYRLCLDSLDPCACVGQEYYSELRASGHVGLVSVWAVVSGELPDGLTLSTDSNNPSVCWVSGTPTTRGPHTFVIRCTTSLGTYMQKEFVIYCLEITTTELEPYIIGQEYKLQMEADGGTGSSNYRWRINSGALPPGLTISDRGYISGTPTASSDGDVEFEVVDLNCESLKKSYYPPEVTLSTSSQTTIKTYHGYLSYGGGDTNLYRRITPEGFLRQDIYTHALTALWPPTGLPYIGQEWCAGAKYVYSGFTEVNLLGVLVSSHVKMLYVACPNEPFPELYILLGSPGSFQGAVDPDWDTGDLFTYWGQPPWNTRMLGFCWPDSPISCDTCTQEDDEWVPLRNYSVPFPYDIPRDVFLDTVNNLSHPMSTVMRYLGEARQHYLSAYPHTLEGFPQGQLNYGGPLGHWVYAHTDGDFTFNLSMPYTDADAEETKTVFSGSGTIAENLPSFKIWTYNYITHRSGRHTTVDYALSCSNLIAGNEYRASVRMYYSTGGYVTVSTTFTATDETHTVYGTVPTPPQGGTIEIRRPSVTAL